MVQVVWEEPRVGRINNCTHFCHFTSPGGQAVSIYVTGQEQLNDFIQHAMDIYPLITINIRELKD